VAWYFGCLALLTVSACTSTPTPASSATPPDELASVLYEIGHPCQPPLASTSRADEPAPNLFVETVLLNVPQGMATPSAETISSIAQQPDVQLLGTPHLIGKPEERTVATFEQHLGILDHPALSQLSFLPKQSESGLHILEFELGFSMPNADPARNPELARTSFLVEGRPDQPLLRSADYPGNPQRKVLAIVKAYPIRSQDDLRSHFECKMRLHQSALEQR